MQKILDINIQNSADLLRDVTKIKKISAIHITSAVHPVENTKNRMKNRIECSLLVLGVLYGMSIEIQVYKMYCTGYTHGCNWFWISSNLDTYWSTKLHSNRNFECWITKIWL